jgi:hypothetical protein
MTADVGARPVVMRVDRMTLRGEFAPAENPIGVVVFGEGGDAAEGAASDRCVAALLRERERFSTLVVELTPEDVAAVALDASAARFEVELAAERLVRATDWILADDAHSLLPVGYVGTGIGAGAALMASTARTEVLAVVCRAGRPDLAGPALELVSMPTLFVVGSEDPRGLELNRNARSRLSGRTELSVVAGTDTTFHEPEALEELARLTGEWFSRHLRNPPPGRRARFAS